MTPERRRGGRTNTAVAGDFGAKVVHFAMAPPDPTPQLNTAVAWSAAATVRARTTVTEVPWTRP